MTPKEEQKHTDLLPPSRVHSWFNTDTLKEVFGIQVKPYGGPWIHAAVNGKPAIFNTRKQAEKFIKEKRNAKS